jgi:hypothetical protein
MDETLSFAVLDHRRDEFLDWHSIRSMPNLKLAVPNVWHYLDLVRLRLPLAQVTALDLERVTLNDATGYDAFVMPAETASAQTLLKPRFTVVVPGPAPVKIPVAYPLARNDAHWGRIVNDWIELKQKDGTFDQLYQHWILGQSAKPRVARWSILDNLLRRP